MNIINTYFDNIGQDKLELLKEFNNKRKSGIYIFYGDGNNGKTTFTEVINRFHGITYSSCNVDLNNYDGGIIAIRDSECADIMKLIATIKEIGLHETKIIFETNIITEEIINTNVRIIHFDNRFRSDINLVNSILGNCIEAIRALTNELYKYP